LNRRTRKSVVVVVAVLLSLCIGAAAQMGPSPFSADMSVKSKSSEKMTGKFYFSGQKLRMDMNTQGGTFAMIHDMPGKVTYMLMPQQKMYMEMHDGQNQMARRGPDLKNLKSFDPDHPCSSMEDTTCEKVGSENVNGRSTDKWLFTDKKNGSVVNVWIDKKLHFPIKTEEKDGSEMEFTNIQEGPAAASMFEIPAGYRKFDMGAMRGGASQ